MNAPYRDTVMADDVHTQLVETSDCELHFYTIDSPDEPKYKLNFECSKYIWWNDYQNRIQINGYSGKCSAEKYILESKCGYFIDDIFVPAHRVNEIKLVTREYKKLLTLKKE